MEYTTSSNDIYFLNDKNIAPGVERACEAGFNAVPSQSAFVEKYEELTAYDKGLSDYIRDGIETGIAGLATSCEALALSAAGISAAAAAEYVRKSGGSVAALSVEGDLAVAGGISSKYFVTGGLGNTVFTAAEEHGGVQFKFEGAASAISVDSDGTTLEQYVASVADMGDGALAEKLELSVGRVMAEVGGNKADIEGRLQDAVDGLEQDIADLETQSDGRYVARAGDRLDASFQVNSISSVNAGIGNTVIDGANIKVQGTDGGNFDFNSTDGHFVVSTRDLSVSTHNGPADFYINNRSLDSYLGENKIHGFGFDPVSDTLGLSVGGSLLSVDASKFVLDKIIDNIQLSTVETSVPGVSATYMVITVETKDEDKKTLTCDVTKLVDVYKASGDGITLGDDRQTFSLDYGVVARKADLDQYISSSIFTEKFVGHLIVRPGDNGVSSLAEVFQNNGLFDEEDRVRNGAMYNVVYDGIETSAAFRTSDGVDLGWNDYVTVHKHGVDPYVQAGEVKDSLYVIGQVRRYEFEEEKKECLERAIAVSSYAGEISSYADDISTALQMSALYLSGLVTAEAASRDEADRQITSDLCAASCLLSAASEAADESLSAALTGVVNEVSGVLSAAVKAHREDTDNPHGVTAAQLSVYLKTETSSAADIGAAFARLSTYAEVKGRLSADGYALSADLSNKVQLSEEFSRYALSSDVSSRTDIQNAFDRLSTYTDIKARLSSDGYALTSKTSSDVQLQTKFGSLSTYADIKAKLSSDGYALNSDTKNKLSTFAALKTGLGNVLTSDDPADLEDIGLEDVLGLLIKVKNALSNF